MKEKREIFYSFSFGSHSTLLLGRKSFEKRLTLLHPSTTSKQGKILYCVEDNDDDHDLKCSVMITDDHRVLTKPCSRHPPVGLL